MNFVLQVLLMKDFFKRLYNLKPADENFDPEIATTCYRRALRFIQSNEGNLNEVLESLMMEKL